MICTKLQSGKIQWSLQEMILCLQLIPQEAVVIPETIDAIRASLKMQIDRLEAVGVTNKYLNMK